MSIPRIRGLKPKEVEAWQLMSEGLNDAEISLRMRIAIGTLRNYVQSVYQFLVIEATIYNKRVKAAIEYLNRYPVD